MGRGRSRVLPTASLPLQQGGDVTEEQGRAPQGAHTWPFPAAHLRPHALGSGYGRAPILLVSCAGPAG